jgi:hypothetical protein
VKNSESSIWVPNWAVAASRRAVRFTFLC